LSRLIFLYGFWYIPLIGFYSGTFFIMIIGIPKELRSGETRIASTPESIKKFCEMGIQVFVESGAGLGAFISDQSLSDAGAIMKDSAIEIYSQSDVILKVQRPLEAGEGLVDEMALLREGVILVGLLSPFLHPNQVVDYAKRNVTAFAMELIPRISRAQSMDVLSSQSNIAGYKAVIDSAQIYRRIFPMMMTAAGTVAPAKVVVLGAGVAGLQAIATARRLGAAVSAFDVRPGVKEQVESLGAKFIEVEKDKISESETEGGYAKEMEEDYARRQREVLHETLKNQDICITTAQIPGKKAPILITKDMVSDMKAGSVIADLAVETGGNCDLSEPDKVIDIDGVTIIGHTNWPALVPSDTSSLYGRNLVNLMKLMIDEENKTLSIDWDDEIIEGALLTRNKAIVNSALLEV